MPEVRPTVVLTTPTRDMETFGRLAALAARLARHGRAEVNIGALAEPEDLPPGGSPWHAYARFNPALEKFVPHPLIAPHVSADAVAANRALLLAKAQVLRELGLGAALWNYLPNFLPESFFEAHPHLRGPRTDHPRRSRREAFAPCVDQPETLEMIRTMTAELKRLVPHLGTFYFKTNDAGPGLCWSYWQYAGSNGPAGCRGRSMGERVAGMLQAVLDGAEGIGDPLCVCFRGNFNGAESADIQEHLPERCAMHGSADAPVVVGTRADACYPVQGIFDPLDVLKSLQGLRGRPGATLFIDTRCSYDRAAERPDVVEAIVAVVDDFLAEPAWGTLGSLQRLHRWCGRWVGEADADALLECFVSLSEAMTLRQAAMSELSSIYGGVSMRFITRPLVFDPAALSAQDEAYFLPHVFNVSESRARMDWLDLHGSRPATGIGPDRDDPRPWKALAFCRRLEGLAGRFEGFADADKSGLLQRTARGLRLYASILRSCAHFRAAQVIRDRCGQDAPPGAAVDMWAGHPDLIIFNEIMRDELDNAAGFASLLERGGLEQIIRSDGAVAEDTFVLPAALIEQVRTKQRLMRRHWLDPQAALPTPNR